MDVADSFQMITGTPLPKAKIKDLVEWTEDAEVALHGPEEEAD